MNSVNKASINAPGAEIRAEARQWFLTLQDKPTRSQRAACDKWRRSNPLHEEAWCAIEAVWQETAAVGQKLAAEEADTLNGYLKAMDNHARRRKSQRRIASLSLCCVLVLSAGMWLENPGWMQNITADHVAAKNERRDIALTDGSTILLDADSAVSVDISAEARRVRLLRGAAYFDVTPSKTPFIVETASGEVQVLGTRFDVRLQDSSTVVTLARGSVAVTTPGQTTPTLLKPGQQVTFSREGVVAPVSVNVRDEMAWHSGRFTFYRARLADVVREVERYRSGRIIIPTAALADTRVTGSFSLADSNLALASLQASVGFRLHKVTERLVIITE